LKFCILSFILDGKISYSRNHKAIKINLMTTHFITAEIDLQATPTELEKAITAELQKQGEPLRWAITAVDEKTQTATVEAVVTTATAES
jgi:hypothetical protein